MIVRKVNPAGAIRLRMRKIWNAFRLYFGNQNMKAEPIISWFLDLRVRIQNILLYFLTYTGCTYLNQSGEFCFLESWNSFNAKNES